MPQEGRSQGGEVERALAERRRGMFEIIIRPSLLGKADQGCQRRKIWGGGENRWKILFCKPSEKEYCKIRPDLNSGRNLYDSWGRTLIDWGSIRN